MGTDEDNTIGNRVGREAADPALGTADIRDQGMRLQTRADLLDHRDYGIDRGTDNDQVAALNRVRRIREGTVAPVGGFTGLTALGPPRPNVNAPGQRVVTRRHTKGGA